MSVANGLGLGLYSLSRQSVTAAEAKVLLAAATSRDFTVYGARRTAAKTHAQNLTGRGLMNYFSGPSVGWVSNMWAASLTCPGFNALWTFHGERHVDGCGATWEQSGVCSGCRTLRRLDADAFDDFLTYGDPDDRDRNATRLWCDEHGFLRSSQWKTDKTCRLPGTPEHALNTIRVTGMR